MKQAKKNNLWENIKEKLQFGLDWFMEKVNALLAKAGMSGQGILAIIILVLVAIAAVFITLGIVSALIFFIVFYVLFIAISSVFASIFNKKDKTPRE